MTKENALRLLKHYKDIGRTDAYEDMKNHILKGSKFSPEEKAELFNKVETKSKGKK